MIGIGHKVAAWRDRHAQTRKVFIIGCGRSGTHWLGDILAAHPSVAITVEKKRIFDKVRIAATDPRQRERLMARVVWQYRLEHARVAPLFYVDKSHPNLWHVEILAQALPNSVFVGIVRNPFATVASMIRHPGIMKWTRDWRSLPVPNSFLGISDAVATSYDSLTAPQKCALRWVSHFNEMKRVAALFPSRVHVLSYERIFDRPDHVLTELRDFIGLPGQIPQPEFKRESLSKWRDSLASTDISAIEEILASAGLNVDNAGAYARGP